MQLLPVIRIDNISANTYIFEHDDVDVTLIASTTVALLRRFQIGWATPLLIHQQALCTQLE